MNPDTPTLAKILCGPIRILDASAGRGRRFSDHEMNDTVETVMPLRSGMIRYQSGTTDDSGRVDCFRI